MSKQPFSVTEVLPAVPAMPSTSLRVDRGGLSILQERDAGEVVVHIPAAHVPVFFDKLLSILVNREGTD